MTKRLDENQVIGIVGSSKAEYNQCHSIISSIIDSYPDGTIFVTGDALGVDHWVELYCIENLLSLSKIYCKTRDKVGFGKRNKVIADYCDKVYSIALPVTKTPCYHCSSIRQPHERTGGCWTGKMNGNYEVRVAQ